MVSIIGTVLPAGPSAQTAAASQRLSPRGIRDNREPRDTCGPTGNQRTSKRSTILYLNALFVILGVAEAAILPFVSILLLDAGLEAHEIGLVLAAMSTAALAVNPAWGWAADTRFGSDRALIGAATLTAVTAIALAVSKRLFLVVVLVTVLWIFRAPFASLVDAIALHRLGDTRRADYGTVRVWMSASFALAAAGWGALYAARGLSLLAPTYAATAVALACWVGLTGRSEPKLPARATRLRYGASAVLRSPPLVAFLLAVLLTHTAFAATWNFLALRIVDLGGSAFLVGIAACMQAAAEVPAMLFTRRISHALGEGGLFAAGCVVYALTFLVFGIVRDASIISATKAIVGVGFAFTYVGSVVVMDRLVPPELRATGQGLVKAVAFGLAPIVGALGGGIVYGSLGPQALFFSTSAIALAAALVSWFGVRKPQRADELQRSGP